MREGWLVRASARGGLYVRSLPGWLLRTLRWGWVIPTLAVVDVAIRWRQAKLWVPVEWLGYVLSVCFGLLWLRAVQGALRMIWKRNSWGYWLSVLLIQGALTFLLVVHFSHYAYFGVPPELNTFTMSLTAPAEAIRVVETQLTATTVVLLIVLTFALSLTWRNGWKLPPRPRYAAIAGGIGILLTPGFLHNVTEGRGNFLPSVNFIMLAGKAAHSYAIGERFHTLPLANRNNLPKVSRRQPYNVLFIVGESLRGQNLSYEGYTRDTTPYQRQFLENFSGQSYIFTHCYTSSIRTNPSVPSILSGVHPMEFPDKLIRTPLMFKYGKVFEGTRTFLISSQSYGDYNYVNFFRSPLLDTLIYQENSGNPPFVWDGMDDSKVIPFLRKELDTAARPGSDSIDKPGGGTAGGSRFFGVIHLNGTHFPYEFPPSFRRWATDAPMDKYDNSILYQDSVIHAILEELRSRGLLENTIVVFTADHGEALGEHGRWGHAHGYPYLEMTRVGAWMYLPKPLAQRYGTALRENSSHNVSNLDWAPTIIDLLGLDSEPSIHDIAKEMMGRSLLTPADPMRVFVVQNDSDRALKLEGFGLLQGNEEFLYHPSSGIRVYDIVKDPATSKNLWSTLDQAARNRWLEAASIYPNVKSEVAGAMDIQEKNADAFKAASVN